MSDRLANIAELWAQGVITEEIARRLDMTKGSVCRLARDARLRGDPRFPARGRFDMTKRKCVPITPPVKTNPIAVRPQAGSVQVAGALRGRARRGALLLRRSASARLALLQDARWH